MLEWLWELGTECPELRHSLLYTALCACDEMTRGTRDARLTRTLRYMRKNMFRPIRLEELALVAGMNRFEPLFPGTAG